MLLRVQQLEQLISPQYSTTTSSSSSSSPSASAGELVLHSTMTAHTVRKQRSFVALRRGLSLRPIPLRCNGDKSTYIAWQWRLSAYLLSSHMHFAIDRSVPGIPIVKPGYELDPLDANDATLMIEDDASITQGEYEYRQRMAEVCGGYLESCIVDDIDRSTTATEPHGNAFKFLRALDRHYMRENNASDIHRLVESLRHYHQQPTESVRLFATNIKSIGRRLHALGVPQNEFTLIAALCRNCLPLYQDAMVAHMFKSKSFDHCLAMLMAYEENELEHRIDTSPEVSTNHQYQYHKAAAATEVDVQSALPTQASLRVGVATQSTLILSVPIPESSPSVGGQCATLGMDIGDEIVHQRSASDQHLQAFDATVQQSLTPITNIRDTIVPSSIVACTTVFSPSKVDVPSVNNSRYRDPTLASAPGIISTFAAPRNTPPPRQYGTRGATCDRC